MNNKKNSYTTQPKANRQQQVDQQMATLLQDEAGQTMTDDQRRHTERLMRRNYPNLLEDNCKQYGCYLATLLLVVMMLGGAVTGIGLYSARNSRFPRTKNDNEVPIGEEEICMATRLGKALKHRVPEPEGCNREKVIHSALNRGYQGKTFYHHDLCYNSLSHNMEKIGSLFANVRNNFPSLFGTAGIDQQWNDIRAFFEAEPCFTQVSSQQMDKITNYAYNAIKSIYNVNQEKINITEANFNAGKKLHQTRMLVYPSEEEAKKYAPSDNLRQPYAPIDQLLYKIKIPPKDSSFNKLANTAITAAHEGKGRYEDNIYENDNPIGMPFNHEVETYKKYDILGFIPSFTTCLKTLCLDGVISQKPNGRWYVCAQTEDCAPSLSYVTQKIREAYQNVTGHHIGSRAKYPSL